MIKVEFSESQYQILFRLLDQDLRHNGLEVLESVVEMRNVLVGATQNVIKEETKKDADAKTDFIEPVGEERL